MTPSTWQALARKHIAELQAALADGDASLSLLVPAYFYPSGAGAVFWAKLVEAARVARVVAIANPANGPGTSVKSLYSNVLQEFAAAGGISLGYVATGYGRRPIAEVKSDIDRWVHYYSNVGGIFFDEQAATIDALPYYREAFAHARLRLPAAMVVGNPGAAGLVEAFLTDPGGADTYVVHEKVATKPLAVPPFAGSYPRGRFAALQYGATATQMLVFVAAARAANVGSVYVTGDVLTNPWDTVATYFDAELAALKESP